MWTPALKIKSKWLSWSFRLAVTAICLALLVHVVDFEYIQAMLLACRPQYLAAAACFYFLGAIGGGAAWLYLLRRLGERGLSLSDTLRLTLIGFVLNNLIPGGIAGDVYRAFGAVNHKISSARAASTVFLERWSSLLALIVSTLIADICVLPLLRSSSLSQMWLPSWLPESWLRLDIFMFIVIAAATASLSCLTYAMLRYIRQRHNASAETASKPNRLQEEATRLGAKWQEFLEELALFDRAEHRFDLFIAAFINMSSPILEGLAFACVAQALNLSISPFIFLAFTPLFRIVSHLPISVNAIGPQEFISIALWEPLGASSSDAVTISLIIHALKIMLSFMCLPLFLAAPKTPSVPNQE
ncbi:flippase-like domain-containing protein [bacterium]|nr:flippase-like domain-containing protein [bacterium]